MQYYQKNLNVLKERLGGIYKKVKEAENEFIVNIKDENDIVAKITDEENNINIYVEKTKKKDAYTMRIEKNNIDNYFHSKYNPYKEAVRQVQNIKPKNRKQIIILGFGLGYHLNKLVKRNQYDKIFIVEPYLVIFYTALCFVDLRPLFKSNNIIYIIENQSYIFELFNKFFSFSLEKDLEFLEHPPSLKMFKKDYSDIYQKIKKSIDYKKINIVTDINQAKLWRNNIILNLPYIYKYPKADDYFGTFNNMPIICIATGPSLNYNIDKLKKAKGKALLIAAGSALKPLLKNNIKPDIVVSMDGTKPNYNNFKSVENVENIYLFSEKANLHKINQEWKGPQVFYTMKRNLSKWVEKIKGYYTGIHTGGSVAHSVIDLAYKLGGNPIIMVGQDLAYSKKRGKTHVEGTANIKKVDKELIEVESVYGKKIHTDEALLSMLTYLNNYLKKRHNDRTFIDATEGGAKIDNTLILPLEETINKYCENEIDIKSILKRNYELNDLKLGPNNVVENTLIELEDATKLLEEQIEKVNELMHNLENNNLKKAKEIEIKINNLENKIINKKNVKYFTEKVLLVQAMKYKKIQAKYYIDEAQRLRKKYKYYNQYRSKQLKEIKESYRLLSLVYDEDKTEFFWRYNSENISK